MCELPVAAADSCANSSTSVQGCDKDQLKQSVIKFDCLEFCSSFILNINFRLDYLIESFLPPESFGPAAC